MKIRSWHVGPNDSKLKGISDQEVLDEVALALFSEHHNSLTLVGLTLNDTKTWSRQQELKEMKGHLRGMLRSKYGREMLDARKLNISFIRLDSR